MATIRTQNGGKVILRDGQVQCECCDIVIGEDIQIGEPDTCNINCDVACYNKLTNPAPFPNGNRNYGIGNSNRNVAWVDHEYIANPDPLLPTPPPAEPEKLAYLVAALQDFSFVFNPAFAPRTGAEQWLGRQYYYNFGVLQPQDPSWPVTWYKNFVSSPSIIRLWGTVGGDVRIIVKKWTRDAPEDGIESFYIPHEGEYACGTCPEPRNASHPVDTYFVLHPKMACYIELVAWNECVPWINLRARRVGRYSPP